MRSAIRSMTVLTVLLSIAAERAPIATPVPAAPISATPAAVVPSKRTEARLQELLREIAKLPRDEQSPGKPAFDALSAKIDAEAAQKDAWRTGLFWHTDLNEAMAVAKQTGKPVLSLRMLGRLDEELSCANSRFFRKMLYVDVNIGIMLRQNFVLHWESLRPVPTVTIDFGDGRTVKRTVTGNSIHYVLLPDGRVLDALPGLVDQPTFRRELQRLLPVATKKTLTEDELQEYWKATRSRLADVELSKKADEAFDAKFNAATAMSKIRIERPLLTQVRNPTVELMTDTNTNQHNIRPKILAKLMNGDGADLPAMNKRVYAELFKAPLDDPDMGLNPPDETALVDHAIPKDLRLLQGSAAQR